MSSSTEVRTPLWARLAGHALWLLSELYCRTLRMRFVQDEAEKGNPAPGTEAVIVAFWHNRIFIPMYFYRRILKGKLPMCALASASKDGALVDTLLRDYKMEVVRGSSHRRGTAAFKELVQTAKGERCICITTDGPRGPLYKSRGGAVRLSSLSGRPIIPISMDFSACWRINKAWDKFIIPKPFSRVTLRWGKRIVVPPHADDDTLAEYLERLDEALKNGRPDFPEIQ